MVNILNGEVLTVRNELPLANIVGKILNLLHFQVRKVFNYLYFQIGKAFHNFNLSAQLDAFAMCNGSFREASFLSTLISLLEMYSKKMGNAYTGVVTKALFKIIF